MATMYGGVGLNISNCHVTSGSGADKPLVVDVPEMRGVGTELLELHGTTYKWSDIVYVTGIDTFRGDIMRFQIEHKSGNINVKSTDTAGLQELREQLIKLWSSYLERTAQQISR
ncbi:hypothetical protein NVP1031O_067 [Vibrio phage 1.031.O._10N.261.46.F8]|nr:hypothetical protein NVP1031O_067 [Vibrio phage 1.031.O._10N.261.46.F8]